MKELAKIANGGRSKTIISALVTLGIGITSRKLKDSDKDLVMFDAREAFREQIKLAQGNPKQVFELTSAFNRVKAWHATKLYMPRNYTRKYTDEELRKLRIEHGKLMFAIATTHTNQQTSRMRGWRNAVRVAA